MRPAAARVSGERDAIVQYYRFFLLTICGAFFAFALICAIPGGAPLALGAIRDDVAGMLVAKSANTASKPPVTTTKHKKSKSWRPSFNELLGASAVVALGIALVLWFLRRGA